MRGQATSTMGPDIIRGALRNGLWNAAALALPGITNVVIVAILIRSLGPTGFAPWATAVGILGLLTILDGGLSATTARNVARAIAGDREAVDLVRAAYAAYAGLAVLVLVVGSAASLLIPAALGAEGSAATSAVILGVVLATDLAVVVGSAGWLGSLRGASRFDLLLVTNGAQVLVALPITVALVPGLGLVGAAIAQLLGRLVGRVVAAAALRRAIPWIRLMPGHVTRRSWRRLGVFTLPILAIGISTQLGIGIDPVIVALSSGPAAVGLYAAGSGLVRYVAFLVFPILSVLLPSFSELAYARPEATAGVLVRCLRLASLLGALAFGTLAVSAAPALEAWIGRSDWLSVQVLVLYAIAHACWTPSQVLILMLIARGRHAIVGAALLVDALANLGLSIALAVVVGPVGVAVSTLILLVVVHALVIPAIAVRRLAVPARAIGTAMCLGFAVGAAVVGVAALIPLPGTAGLLARAAIASIAGLGAIGLDQWVARAAATVSPASSPNAGERPADGSEPQTIRGRNSRRPPKGDQEIR